MSTVVYQGFQTQLLETTLRLKLSPTNYMFETTADVENVRDIDQMSLHNEYINKKGWSFLQALSSISQNPKGEMIDNSSYVHPSAKRSSSPRLSEKSLELCTENLGSETGTDIIAETNSFFANSLTISDYPNSEKSVDEDEQQRLRCRRPSMDQYSRKVVEKSRNFPPPLTTMSGSSVLRVQPHREGGRLIIKAIESPSTHSYLQAERSNGRLKLSILKNNYNNNLDTNNNNGARASTFDSELETIKEIGAGNKDEDADTFEGDSSEEKVDDDDIIREESIRLQQQRQDGEVEIWGRDMDGNSFEVEVEMGMENFQRPGRCLQGGHGNNKGLCNWKHLCVATS